MMLPTLQTRADDLRKTLETACGDLVDSPGIQHRIGKEVFERMQRDQGQVAAALLAKPWFIVACRECHTEPTRRQANRALRQEGAVYQYLLAHPDLMKQAASD